MSVPELPVAKLHDDMPHLRIMFINLHVYVQELSEVVRKVPRKGGKVRLDVGAIPKQPPRAPPC